MNLYTFDSRHVWHEHIGDACRRAGIQHKRIGGIEDIDGDGWGFIRPHPAHMPAHRDLDAHMRGLLDGMIQDRAQVEVYEDKSEQWRRWGDLMPETQRFSSLDDALSCAPDFPVVSKADEGASSVNVRIIKSRAEYEEHARQAFSGEGIKVNRCADRTFTRQRGYLLIQRFIPHDRTYRVNIVGNRMAIFERYNYKDRPVAQTGNTKGVCEFTPLHDSLLDYAAEVGRRIGSRFVALDVLKDHDEWTLLETSLAWPWTPKDYSDVPLIGGGQWGGLWDALCEDLLSGAFESTSP